MKTFSHVTLIRHFISHNKLSHVQTNTRSLYQYQSIFRTKIGCVGLKNHPMISFDWSILILKNQIGIINAQSYIYFLI